ncbi:MAG: OmpH family outer membrane protein [Bacteroidetes bacterium]|jgi:outer membrane protein|nr:OmpH family outer membrane protein [Bacteroidota bacterium]
MKNLSTVLNIVLLVAVGILYYLHFSADKKPEVKKPGYSMAPGTPMTRPAIAYVELDSLLEKIAYIKDKKKEFESQQDKIESEWQNGYRGLEEQKNNFLKKGASITQDEAQQFQNQLLSQQDKIDQRKQMQAQDLSEAHYKFMEKIQKNLKDFLAEYNKDKNFMYIFTTGTGLEYMAYKDSSMNITNDVIDGLNKIMVKETKK